LKVAAKGRTLAKVDALLRTGRIIAFLDDWCSYGAADLAGLRKLSYPTTVRILRF